jgi:hypothetical protein
MTISTLETRGDWWPSVRIEGLRRYAFIGDSTVYGTGVAPDETLPFFAERFLNEALPCWPVEAVNYGVCGYNIWNSWLGFKAAPQVFDGVVLALCLNDAEMFSRTFDVHLLDGLFTTWKPDHPFRPALDACFDDIAAFCQQAALPAAIVVCNQFGSNEERHAAELIGELCAARGLLNFETFPLFSEHGYAVKDLYVSQSDGHPSALAHKTTARRLVLEMARQDWFCGLDGDQIGRAPERILAATHTMMRDEDYPPDAAYGWALRTLDVKTLVARRLAAIGNEGGFAATAEVARNRLESARRHWDTAQRAEACLQAIGSGANRLGETLQALQTARLRLEELGFALARSDAVPALALLCRRVPPAGVDFNTSMAQATAIFARFHHEVRRIQASLDVAHERLDQLPSVQRLSLYVKAFAREATALDEAIAQTVALFSARRTELPDIQQACIAALLAGDLGDIGYRVDMVLEWMTWAEAVSASRVAEFTTIEATLKNYGDDKAPVRLCAEYSVPHRLGFVSPFLFETDERPGLIRFHVPLFYAGRVAFRTYRRPGTKVVENVELLSVELLNEPGPRKIVPISSFQENEQGDLVSPPIFLV